MSALILERRPKTCLASSKVIHRRARGNQNKLDRYKNAIFNEMAMVQTDDPPQSRDYIRKDVARSKEGGAQAIIWRLRING